MISYTFCYCTHPVGTLTDCQHQMSVELYFVQLMQLNYQLSAEQYDWSTLPAKTLAEPWQSWHPYCDKCDGSKEKHHAITVKTATKEK